MLHPFVPFITEELWHHINDKPSSEFLINEKMPVSGKYDKHLLSALSHTSEIISAIRDFRKNNNLPPKSPVSLTILSDKYHNKAYDPVLIKMANLESVHYAAEKPVNSYSFMAGKTEFFIKLDEHIDKTEEILKAEKDLDYLKGFLDSILKKLTNDSFINNAPSKVIELEQKKRQDTEIKIQMLKAKISQLKS
jgi:valyl-tRNA synthetase